MFTSNVYNSYNTLSFSLSPYVSFSPAGDIFYRLLNTL